MPQDVLTFPQPLQWWRLQVRVNSQVQIIHIVALWSGIHIGALVPSWASLSVSSWVTCRKCVIKKAFTQKEEQFWIFYAIPDVSDFLQLNTTFFYYNKIIKNKNTRIIKYFVHKLYSKCVSYWNIIWQLVILGPIYVNNVTNIYHEIMSSAEYILG